MTVAIWIAIVLLAAHQLHSTGALSDAQHRLGAKLSGHTATAPKDAQDS